MKSKIVVFYDHCLFSDAVNSAASDLYWLDHTEPVTDPLRIYGTYAWA